MPAGLYSSAAATWMATQKRRTQQSLCVQVTVTGTESQVNNAIEMIYASTGQVDKLSDPNVTAHAEGAARSGPPL